MSEPINMENYKAKAKHWADVEEWAAASPPTSWDSCILELRSRVAELEAKYETMRLATLEWGADVDKVKRWSDQHLQRIKALETVAGIRSGPESSLVGLVADAIAAQATSAGIVNDRPARGAIAVIAGQLRAQCFVHAADWLEREAAQPASQEDYD
jgi:hypothetical protein